MTSIKTYIDWEYNIKPSYDHKWENSSLDECDVIISVNRISKFNVEKKKVFWLYEPRAIYPDLYNIVQARKLNYDLIATHMEKIDSKNNYITIPPCFPSWIEKDEHQVYEKTKNISMIASSKVMCNGHKYRQDVANSFSCTIDLYGHGRSKTLDKKIEGLKEYRFSIAMENSRENNYYTEKIIDCFLTGTIPIYWGCKNINDIFDPNGIIELQWFINNYKDFNYQEEYSKRKDAIFINYHKALKMNLTSSDGINEIISRIF